MSGMWQGGYTPFLSKRVNGYAACGTVNARNRMGGFTGRRTFTVVIDLGIVKYVEIEKTATGLMTDACLKGMRLGKLPQPPLGGASLTDAATTDVSNAPAQLASQPSSNGLSTRPMPEGAYIAGVTPNSPAATAGLTAGMLITAVNGIPLAGMGDAMIKVIDAANGPTLTILGGKSVKLATKD